MSAGPTIYFVRHGETDWNRERRYQGQRDIPLNERGRAQAMRNGQALLSLGEPVLSADFIASPMARTRETMRIVRNALGLDPDKFATDSRLVELHYGHWEGQLASDLPEIDPDGIAARAAEPFLWRPIGGENYSDLSERLARWLETIERDTVVVSHGGVSRALRCILIAEIGQADVPQLEVPQDRVLIIANGAVRWL